METRTSHSRGPMLPSWLASVAGRDPLGRGLGALAAHVEKAQAGCTTLGVKHSTNSSSTTVPVKEPMAQLPSYRATVKSAKDSVEKCQRPEATLGFHAEATSSLGLL